MRSTFSRAALAARPHGLARLAVALLCGSIAQTAVAQSLVSSYRVVQSGTAVVETSAYGPWNAAFGTSATQNSNVAANYVSASGTAFVAGGNTVSYSNALVTFNVPDTMTYMLNGSVQGYRTTSGAPSGIGNCSVTLAHGGVNIAVATCAQSAPFNATIPFSFVGTLSPGEYSLFITGGATGAYPSLIIGGYAQYSVELSLLSVCGAGSTQGCLTAHASPGCSDEGCCNFVCVADPFCCDAVWDFTCASEADAACTPAYVTGPIINPWNGHRHRLLDMTYWANSLPGVAGTEHGFVTIDSALENAWLRDALLNNIAGWTPVPAFIGLSDISQEGTFVWSSGKPFTYSNWYTGEPNDQDGEDVVEMSHLHGRWNDISSAVTRAAITDSWRSMCGSPLAGDCYEEGSTKGCSDEACCNAVCDVDAFCCDAMWDDVCASEASSYCHQVILAGPFSNPSTGHRYYVLSPTSWSLAERAAREMGGHLASLETSGEAAWLQWAVHFGLGYDNYAIGLDDQAIAGTFRWANGAPVGYTAWRSGQPSLPNAPGRASVGSDGLWSEVPIGSISTAVIEATCLGDFTMDGTVNGADLAALLGAWGTHDPTYDLTFDGVIDGADLSVLLGGWGSCIGGPACVVHASPGSHQPGCDSCVCGLDPVCCEITWDSMCVYLAKYQCPFACQCP